MTELEFIRRVLAYAQIDNDILVNVAAALYRDEPSVTPRTSPSPEHAFYRNAADHNRKNPKHFDNMAKAIVRLWQRFEQNRPDFWHDIVTDGWNDGFTHYNAFLPLRYALAGGFIDGIDNAPVDQGPTPPLWAPPTESDTYRAIHLDRRAPEYEDYYEDYDDNVQRLREQEREYERETREIQRDHDEQRAEHARAQKVYDTYAAAEEAREPLTRARARLQKLSTKFQGDDLYREFFAGTPLAHLYPEPELPEPEVTPELAFSGTWVLAAQGYGKTTLLSKLILDRMEEPCSIIIFDSKPELSTFFRDRRFPKDVVVIDPDPYLALNPLDLGTHNLDILMYLFSSLLDAKFTPLQSQALRQAVYLTTKVPNADFNTFMDIIIGGGKKYSSIIETLPARERNFWETQYDSGTYRDTRAQLLWRLDLLTPPDSIARTMFEAPKTKVRMAPLMDGNTITIINNSIADLGEMQSEFFSRMFLTMILAAAEQRAKLPDQKKRPCYIFMDEAHTVIANEPRVADIIYRTRSQKIALLCAHQSLSQIRDERVVSALADCAIRYANCDNDAASMAGYLGTSADVIRGLSVGEFALSVRGSPQAQIVKIPLPDWSPYPMLPASEIEQRHKRFKQTYCYTPTIPQQPAEQSPHEITEWGGKPVL